MYGAILGDIIGSPYEFDRGNKTKTFPLFSRKSSFTDDTVMTVAIADALLHNISPVKTMQKWGHAYPYESYGVRFSQWLNATNPKPYNSYGNGAAMRVSPAGWLGNDIEQVDLLAKKVTEVTHNHPEGIKGAQAVARAVYLARHKVDKTKIKAEMESYGYNLSRTCNQIRPKYHHVESCQKTVPEAITAFLESTDFEDAIRLAVSLGGDCDTLAAITGSIAEAFYGVPVELKKKADSYLKADLKKIVDEFYNTIGGVKYE